MSLFYSSQIFSFDASIVRMLIFLPINVSKVGQLSSMHFNTALICQHLKTTLAVGVETLFV